MNLEFKESKDSGYKQRTIENASAHCTLAFAVTFDSPGEKLTKSSVLGQGKKYVPISLHDLNVTNERVDKIVNYINNFSTSELTFEDGIEPDAIKFIRKDKVNASGYFEELSNFTASNAPIIDDMGLEYMAVESYYQAQKTLDRNERLKFTSDYLKNPYEYGNASKKMGQKLSVRPDWEKIKYGYMRIGLAQKFRDQRFRDILLSTGDRQIIEWTWWGDKCWGKSVRDGKGANALGKLLMELRNKLSGNKKNITLNVAGNGINTIVKSGSKLTQETLDAFVFEILDKIINHPKFMFKVKLIRSGGQNGSDLSIRSFYNKIPLLVLAPQGWTFRNIDGVDVSDEKLFKERFYINNDIKIEVLTNNFSRESVEKDCESMYIFTDNLERTSAPNAKVENIDQDCWYYKKYKNTTNKPIHYGTLNNPTTALIRGLNNSYPISTMIAYGTNLPNDSLELFKKIIDDEINQIKNDLCKFKTLKIGNYRIGQGGLKAKLPQQHQEYLDKKLLELKIDNSGVYPKILH